MAGEPLLFQIPEVPRFDPELSSLLNPVKDIRQYVDPEEEFRETVEAPDGVMMFVEGLSGNPVYYPLLQQQAIEAIESRKKNWYRILTVYDHCEKKWSTSVSTIRGAEYDTLWHDGIIYTKAIALTYIFEKEQS